ncbi:GNAT family N-acetyltransferase [Lacticaseibacillus rhamnosus]|uniref:GNAT family N-acetyltransferase n=1 Tax=Lacticaseibacillus rhamnosus TaxID=47715 RepID=UPI000B1CEB8D|nr:GNAT family N-acetyltransferase [Lacticaseibacillus rhamnosus]
MSKAKLILSPAFYTDLKEIRHMYQQAFKSLYGKYQDRETNPYCESLESLQKKFKRPNNAFFFIIVEDKRIGLIRVVIDRKNSAARISPFLILPSYQGKGYAQLGLQLIEEQFPLIQNGM